MRRRVFTVNRNPDMNPEPSNKQAHELSASYGLFPWILIVSRHRARFFPSRFFFFGFRRKSRPRGPPRRHSYLIFDILPALLAASLFFCHAQSEHLRRAHTRSPRLPAYPGSPYQGSPCLALMTVASTTRMPAPRLPGMPTVGQTIGRRRRPARPRAPCHSAAPRARTPERMCPTLRRRTRGNPQAWASVTAAWAACSPCSRRRPWRPASPWRRAPAGRR